LAFCDDPLLGIFQGRRLTLVVFRGRGLVVSWRFPLAGAVADSFVFGLPPVIASHLMSNPPPPSDTVRLALDGSEVSLMAQDAVGDYELRWRFDLNQFSAPAELGRLLALPPKTVMVDYVQIADAMHRAVASLADIESRYQVHRTKLAIALGLTNGHLQADGREIDAATDGFYYFDPRLIMRALEFVRGERVEIGLTDLGQQRAFFSIADRQPDHVTHCALLSIGPEMQRLVSNPPKLRP
jgi:hypothetical protein